MRASEFVIENASAGATSSGNVATVAQPLSGVIGGNHSNFFSGTVSASPFPNTPYKKRKKPFKNSR